MIYLRSGCPVSRAKRQIKRIRGFKKHHGADQLKNLARIPDSVCLEVRIVDRIINFRGSALFGILVFRPLFFPGGGGKQLPIHSLK